MENDEIVNEFNKVICIAKVIESNVNEFEAIVDTFFINVQDFDKISSLAKQIYGSDCAFHFNIENEWNIVFGVIRRSFVND